MSDNSHLQFKITTISALVLVFIGTGFYHFFEKWSLLDSFYFTIITLTTIGYGDLAPTTSISKIFTIIYVLMGIGIIGSFITLWASKRHLKKAARSNNSSKDKKI